MERAVSLMIAVIIKYYDISNHHNNRVSIVNIVRFKTP